MTRPVTVRGGAFSIAADFEGMTALARVVDTLRSRLAATATRALRTQSDPLVLVTSTLDPPGAFELAELLALTVALGGAAALVVSELAAALRGAVSLYESADRVVARVGPAMTAVRRLPNGVMLWRPGDPLSSADGLLTSDPDLVSVAVDLATQSIPFGSLPDARTLTGLLATQYPDGRPRVRRDPDATTADGQAPTSLAEVFDGLTLRDRESNGGATDVRILTTRLPNGRLERRAIVDITGTTDWSPLPGSGVASDLTTNLHALAGQTTTYARGVAQAMREAGVDAGMPVMLVGHSQGGMVAVSMARDYVASGTFNITHVVTAGSPIGSLDIPSSVQVLALENRGDLVPRADGADNPVRTNVLTVGVDRGGRDVLDQHDLETAYRPGAADVDASADPGIEAWLRGASGFLRADSVRTEVFQVSRSRS